MKRLGWAAVALVLLVPIGVSADSSPTASLKLTIIGSHAVHRGQKIVFKALVTNGSSMPIVVASQNASPDFELKWVVTNSSGLEPRKPFVGFACRVGGPGWYNNLMRRLQDSDLTLLQPGDKLEFVYDVSSEYELTMLGTYQVTASYTYVPPRLDGGTGMERDRFGQKYDLTELGPEALAMLKHAGTVSASSTSTLVVE